MGESGESAGLVFAAVLLAAAIIVGALLHGGLYELESADSYAYKMNRFTGKVVFFAGYNEYEVRPGDYDWRSADKVREKHE